MNYHQVKMEYLKAVRLCISGYYIQAKRPLKWVMTHSKKYRALHLDSGLYLAGIYKKLSEYKYAVEMLNYLIVSYKDDRKIQPILHLDLATAKFHCDDLSGAEMCVCEAKGYSFESLNLWQLSYLMMLEGRYFNLCGDYERAINCQERAWSICEKDQSNYRLMQVVSNIGHYIIDHGDDDEGGKLVKEATRMACRTGALFWIARNCLVLMQLAFKRGNILEAKDYGKRCFMLAYSNGYRNVVEEACQSTGDYYRAIGDVEVAEVFYQKAVSVGTESPAQVLEKVDRIYDTAYSDRRLNVKFTSSGNRWVLDESIGALQGTRQAEKFLKYRYIIGSVKSKSKGPPRIGGEDETASSPDTGSSL